MDTNNVFQKLNDELNQRNIQREIVICGGAALIALDVISRETKDVDVLKPKIDSELKAAAAAVAKSLKLAENWLNNGPAILMKELPPDWESHCEVIFEGSNLVISSLGRRDLINSKLYAAADRISDVGDLVALKPLNSELKNAREWVLQKDASGIWPKIVDECLSEVRKRLGYGK